MTPRTRPAAAAGLLLALAGPAAAEELHGTKAAEAFTEADHQVDVTLSPGYARLVIRRTLHNGGSEIDEAVLAIDHPEASVAVGLRTQGRVGGRTVWLPGKLLPAELAAAQYLELTGRGEAIARDPALLYWVSPETLGLQVFPCAPQEDKVVEYTLLVPGDYAEGREQIGLPVLGTDARRPDFTIHAESGDRVEIGDVEIAPGGSGIRRAADSEILVKVRRPKAPGLATRFAAVDLGTGRSYVHAALRTAERISTVPRGAWVVVLLDGSRSLDVGLPAQVAATDAYLSHLPDARIAALVFDRGVHEVTPGFVATNVARERLAQWPTDAHNGSAIDRALERAAKWLGQAPATAPRRVVVFTDTLTRSALDDAAMQKLIGGVGGLVHLVQPGVGSASLDRQDDLRWAAAVRATGGLAWNGISGGELDGDRRVFEELARPLRYRLRHVTIDGLAAQTDPPTDLAEGTEWIFETVASGAAQRLIVDGELWGKSDRREVAADADETRVQAALATVRHDLDLQDDEARRLAEAGGAVTPYTSYLALEPGVRPSTAGIDRDRGEGIGLGAIGTLGHGSGFGTGQGFSGPRIDPAAWLRDALTEARTRCGATATPMTVEIESTYAEVVDVPRAVSDPPDPKLEACVAEAAWALELPSVFDAAFRRWPVAL
jgi:hypothetical protein